MLHLIELDSLFSILIIIIYGLFSLKSVYTSSSAFSSKGKGSNYTHFYLNDVYFFASLFPLLFTVGYFMESGYYNPQYLAVSVVDMIINIVSLYPIDFLLAILLIIILPNFASFESVLLLLFAFIGSYFILHSVDLLTFYITLEAQNFCFLVLCGLGSSNLTSTVSPKTKGKKNILLWNDSSSFSVEATLKFFLLSAFSSGVILFWFSTLYLQTGLSVLTLKNVMYTLENDSDTWNLYIFQILCAIIFKLGAAPVHLWVIQIYSSVKRSLLMYISTVPKLALFGFWINSFHSIWTDYSVVLFALFSIVIGSLGAYGQPGLRTLFAYSTVNEIGLMLIAIETAGFHSLFQHLTIYIISQFLLWNIYDKRFFSVLAVSLAGIPPLAGFFGKAWIFWHVSSFHLYTVLIIGLFCTGISLVYYLRVLRLFWTNSKGLNTRVFISNRVMRSYNTRFYSWNGFVSYDSRTILTSLSIVLLIFLPLFVIKPFVL